MYNDMNVPLQEDSAKAEAAQAYRQQKQNT